VGFLLRQVNQRHTGLFASLIGDETTPTQWAVLARLMEAGASSQNALGRQTAMDAATVRRCRKAAPPGSDRNAQQQ
jgi:DNA-binding MarR family transcriptional regulator